jgi:hypothetical protein
LREKRGEEKEKEGGEERRKHSKEGGLSDVWKICYDEMKE